MDPLYRARQYFKARGARVTAEERAAVLRYLPTGAWCLFDRMPAQDRRHAVDVMQALVARGHDEPELLAAALLHDAGKTDRSATVPTWCRIAVVLLKRLAPSAPGRLAANQPGHWRHYFHLQWHHAELGAALAAEAGCAPRTVELIRCHQRRGHDPWLVALQAADGMN